MLDPFYVHRVLFFSGAAATPGVFSPQISSGALPGQGQGRTGGPGHRRGGLGGDERRDGAAGPRGLGGDGGEAGEPGLGGWTAGLGVLSDTERPKGMDELFIDLPRDPFLHPRNGWCCSTQLFPF